MAKRVVLAYSGGLDTSVAVRWLMEQPGRRGRRRGRRRRPVGRRRRRGLGGHPPPGPGRRGGRGRWWSTPGGRWPRSSACPAIKANATLRGQVPARLGAVPAGHRPPPGGRRPARTAPTPWPTAAPARATTRSASRWGPVRSPPTSRCWPRPGSGASAASSASSTPPSGRSRSRSTKEKLYSIDENLWGKAIECGVIEDPWAEAPDDVYTLTRIDGHRARRGGGRLRGRDRRSRWTAGRCRPTSSSPRWAGWPARPGSGGSTWSRTAGSGSRAARSTSARQPWPSSLAHADLEDLTLERDLAPREGPARAALGRAGLRRHVVLPAQGGPRRLRRRVPAPRHRRGPAPLRAAGRAGR